jgi:arylsulfatase A-like enzyme
MNKFSQPIQINFYSLLKYKLGLIVFFTVLIANSSFAQDQPNSSAHLTSKVIQNKPNIIIILTDDMGFSDISSYEGPYHTPNIDRLAKQGMRFTNYYSPSPICSPSRTGLLTGMEPNDWNITSFEQTRKGNRAVDQADYLDPIAPTIARTLKKAGYATAHFGKWHMGGGRDVYNAPKFSRYGFEEHSSTYESPDPDPLLTATDWIWSPQDSVKRWDRTGYFVDKTLDFLKRHKGEPSFINLWPDDMHTPWVPNKKQEDRHPKGSSSETNFEKVLHEYDRQIGRLMDGLKELGIAKNTIVIFTSDNGPLPTFNARRSGQMRGSKLSLYQGGVRLPFIVRWPEQIPAGKVDSTSVISGMDIFPTLASIVGVQMPARFNFDGESREAALYGNETQRKKPLFWDYGSHGNAEAFHYPEGKDRSPNLAIRQGKWKLLMNYDGSNIQLYNMNSDPDEKDNIVELHSQIVKRLKKKLILWRNNAPELRNFR